MHARTGYRIIHARHVHACVHGAWPLSRTVFRSCLRAQTQCKSLCFMICRANRMRRSTPKPSAAETIAPDGTGRYGNSSHVHSRFAHVHSTYNLTRDWPGPHRGAPYGRDASGHIYADQMLRIRGANGCKSCRFSPNSYQLRHFFGPFNMFNNAMEIYLLTISRKMNLEECLTSLMS